MDFNFPVLSTATLEEWRSSFKKEGRYPKDDPAIRAGWQKFAKIGGGYFPIPEDLKRYLETTKKFALSLDSSWKRKWGYFETSGQQFAIFYRKNDWKKYPPDIAVLADEMSQIGVFVLLKTLQSLGINSDLKEITGGLSEAEGDPGFKVMHYNSKKEMLGIDVHKDNRWITVLWSDQPGLQAEVDGEFVEVKPSKDHFFIHVGIFLEKFINDGRLCQALQHKVVQVKEDRVSFGAFLNGYYPSEGYYVRDGEKILWKKD